MFNLKDKIVLVTGGTGLLGKTYCKEFSLQGANVIMADLSKTQPKKVSSELLKNNRNY